MYIVIPRSSKKNPSWIRRSCRTWKEGTNMLGFVTDLLDRRSYLTFHYSRWYLIIDKDDEMRFRDHATRLYKKKATRVELKQYLETVYQKALSGYKFAVKVRRIPIVGPRAKGVRRWALQLDLLP